MDLTVVATFGLLLVRPGMVVAVTPALGGSYVPALLKVGLTVLLALLLAPLVPVPAGGTPVGLLVAREAAIGLSLALAFRALIGAAEFAGYIASQQIGFSYAATIDPASGVRNTMLASLYGMLATLAFLLIDGHHQVLRALVASYEALPIGAGSVDGSIVAGVRDMLGLVFTVAARLAAPIVIVLLMLELIVGLISRAAPALNFMVVGFPLRMLVGLIVLAAVVGIVPSVAAAMLEPTLRIAARLAEAFR